MANSSMAENVWTSGKQRRYCPNCGKLLYDSYLSMNHVMSMMCSDICRENWLWKYTSMILFKDGKDG